MKKRIANIRQSVLFFLCGYTIPLFGPFPKKPTKIAKIAEQTFTVEQLSFRDILLSPRSQTTIRPLTLGDPE